jgi:hypothetical protein
MTESHVVGGGGMTETYICQQQIFDICRILITQA